jgi:hypothetical protein
MAAAIRAMGVRVVGHWEVFAETASDAAYLQRCADEGWIPITADSDVHTEALQKILIRRTRLQVFRLTRNHWPWQDKIAAFVAALPTIEACIKERPGPFIARIDRHGRISRLEVLGEPEST